MIVTLVALNEPHVTALTLAGVIENATLVPAIFVAILAPRFSGEPKYEKLPAGSADSALSLTAIFEMQLPPAPNLSKNEHVRILNCDIICLNNKDARATSGFSASLFDVRKTLGPSHTLLSGVQAPAV
jgi:hypothetical protein